jgi:hypothetical protein
MQISCDPDFLSDTCDGAFFVLAVYLWFLSRHKVNYIDIKQTCCVLQSQAAISKAYKM